MARRRYQTYRGRPNWGRRLLVLLIVLLAVALVAAVVGVFVLRDHIVYTDHGPRIDWSFGRGSESSPTATLPPQTSPPAVVIESPSPSPTAAATPTWEMLPRRDTTLGLVPVELSALLDGTAGESLAAKQGAIFVMTEERDLPEEADTAALRAANQALPYSVALVGCFGADGAPELNGEERSQWIETVAAMGFDEIVLANADYTAYLEAHGDEESRLPVDEQKVTAFYEDLRAALDGLGYEGRLSVVCPQETFLQGVSAGGQSGEAVAKVFDRVYVPGGSWGGFNLYGYLKEHAFRGTTADVVTITKNALPAANFAWAVLPLT